MRSFPVFSVCSATICYNFATVPFDGLLNSMHARSGLLMLGPLDGV